MCVCGGGGGGGGGDYILIATPSPPDDSCIKMSRDESHFNVSFTVRDKVTRQSRSRIKPRPFCLLA